MTKWNIYKISSPQQTWKIKYPQQRCQIKGFVSIICRKLLQFDKKTKQENGQRV